MNREQLQNEILNALPQRTLKEQLKTHSYVFAEKELLAIAFYYAPSFDERLRLLQLLADYAPTVSEHADKCIIWQKSCLERFKCHGEDEIYELHIKEEPDAYDERYLCRSFETALEMIDGFYKEYDCAAESPLATYEIVKRKILRSGQPFAEDWAGECSFSAGKVLLSVTGFAGENEFGQCASDCENCLHPCLSIMDAVFPVLIADRAPVRYYERGQYPQYGIHLNFDRAEKLPDLYIVPLDAQMPEADSWPHKHIPCPDVEEVSELPVELQEKYDRFLVWLDAHYTENYERKEL